MTFLIHTLPWLGIRQGADKRKKKRLHPQRTDKSRVVPQHVVEQMRAEYLALKINGRAPHGSIKPLLARYGIGNSAGCRSYWFKVLNGELRDSEREC